MAHSNEKLSVITYYLAKRLPGSQHDVGNETPLAQCCHTFVSSPPLPAPKARAYSARTHQSRLVDITAWLQPYPKPGSNAAGHYKLVFPQGRVTLLLLAHET